MKNNDLHRSQPHSQALSDGALENVSGGWSMVKKGVFYLNISERDYLKEDTLCGVWEVEGMPGAYKVTDKKGKAVSKSAMKKLLGKPR